MSWAYSVNNNFTFKKQEQFSWQNCKTVIFQHIIYHNIARVLALYKSYWVAMNKIFICARPCVNKMTWAFFFPWLQNFCPVKLHCSFPLLGIRKKPAKNCPIFQSALIFKVLIHWEFIHEFIWLWFSPFLRKLWAFHSRLSVNWIKSSRSNQSIKCVVFLTSQ